MKVSDLKIALQTGSDNTYYASWKFASTVKNTTTTTTVKVGSLVSIKSGATYYNGVAIPDWVMSQKWYISQVSGDRAVLGKNESGTNNIVSPISTKYLTGATTSSSSSTTTVDESTLDHYEVHWYYTTGDGFYYTGSSSDVKPNPEDDNESATYSPPSNAGKIRVTVKPVSKTYKVNDKDVSYWTGEKATYDLQIDEIIPPEKPSSPNVEIEKYKLTATLDNISDPKADKIRFVVYNGATWFASGDADVKACLATFTCNLSAGGNYRVRCQAIFVNNSNDEICSKWSEWTEGQGTIPIAPKLKSVRASSKTSVHLTWDPVTDADTYEIEYAEKLLYFEGSNATSSQGGIETTSFELTGLESGKQYFFRVRAVNDEKGEGAWSDILSVSIGEPPTAPTTWSSTTTVVTGEKLNLYWVHNAADASKQTYAELEMIIDGITETQTIKTEPTEEDDEENPTNVHPIDTTKYPEGTVIQWRVRTAGVTKEYGDWSVQRTVDVYAPATLALSITDREGTAIDTITSYPFYVKGLAGPSTQSPIGYHVVVKSNQMYETVDNLGNFKMVNNGDEIYSKYYDTTDPLTLELFPSSIDLENAMKYTLICTVSMNSGLTAESSLEFTVSWVDALYEPNAEISIDNEHYAAYIRPYCIDDEGNAVEDVTLSVYRRDYDGRYTEIMSGIDPLVNSFITDPHPALDYARYRIIATSNTTGAVSYYDVPAYPVGCKAVVIQWDDEWSNFNTYEEPEFDQGPWSGNMLKLPYNIDVTENNKPDTSLVEYVGRSHPVSYYGTHLGTTANWNLQVVKSDTETIAMLRRLAIYMGDVYVREPSGVGYWANITVSFSQKHCELTVPVTFNITRVEGGV